MKASPLAPDRFPDLPNIRGVRFAAAEAGVKYTDRLDVMLAVAQPGSSVAGVFTSSATRSAPVLDCQSKLVTSAARPEQGTAILVNSGNANAFTGHRGEESVLAVCRAVSSVTDVPINRVFTASTGVIGEPLPHEKIISIIGDLDDALAEDNLSDAARAIMTTDTFAKGSHTDVKIGGTPVKIAGIAKGSGMIAPDMATMLVYIFTDAGVEPALLQNIISDLNKVTFNAITVDSDTSTSDSLMLIATGASGAPKLTSRTSSDAMNFIDGLHKVMLDLAHQVVRDGEGATKFVEVRISGAKTNDDADKVARAIANSPLVKTAIAGEDPNWGRIVMAIGKSGATADRDLITIHFGNVLVAEKGWVAASYTEDAGASYMKQPELEIAVDLGIAEGKAKVWTCDLTHGYISINADYRS